MKQFKFLHKPPDEMKVGIHGLDAYTMLYGWNVYEQMVIHIYKFCFQTNQEFVGYYKTFMEGNTEKTLRITAIRHGCFDNSDDVGILYMVTLNETRQVIYSFRVARNIIESINNGDI